MAVCQRREMMLLGRRIDLKIASAREISDITPQNTRGATLNPRKSKMVSGVEASLLCKAVCIYI